MPDTSAYKEDLRRLSDELIRLQTPIKILDAIKWPREMEARFLESNGKQLPAIDAEFYQRLPLPFDPDKTRQELSELRLQTRKRLGRYDKLGKILIANIEQYLQVIDMLQHRGKADFGEFSRRLYGSANHKLHGDRHNLRQLGDRLSYIFSLPAALRSNRHHPKEIAAPEAVDILGRRLKDYFHSDDIRVRLSDGIVSDAAVGAIRSSSTARRCSANRILMSTRCMRAGCMWAPPSMVGLNPGPPGSASVLPG